MGSSIVTCACIEPSSRIEARNPSTIALAPKIRKQPNITVEARRTSMRPVSIRKPIAATEMIATAVAIVPSKMLSAQSTAETMALLPA